MPEDECEGRLLAEDIGAGNAAGRGWTVRLGLSMPVFEN